MPLKVKFRPGWVDVTINLYPIPKFTDHADQFTNHAGSLQPNASALQCCRAGCQLTAASLCSWRCCLLLPPRLLLRRPWARPPACHFYQTSS